MSSQIYSTRSDLLSKEVNEVWSGLGYYSRAKRMHEAACLVVKDYKGRLPNNAKDLESIPGIGPYTAGVFNGH